MGHTLSYYDLREAFAEDGCPICRLALAAAVRWIAAINYESAGDPGVRAELRASFGFCAIHGQQWLHQANVLATATIYVDVLTRVVAERRMLSVTRASTLAGVAAFLGAHTDPGHGHQPLLPSGRCPVCQAVAETEAMLLDTLLAALPDPAFGAAYRASGGLCLPHLRRALAQASDEGSFGLLRDVAVAREECLLAQLREIIRRSDYRFSHEPAGEERGGAERAVRHVAGAPGCPV